MNVVIYARYSSHSQTEQSIEGQIAVCRDYAKRNNYTIIGEYIDRAMTGTNDNRPEFQKMIKDSKAKIFQGVLVYQLDRFGRNIYDISHNEYYLKKNGVCLLSARENINNDDASNTMLKGVLMTMAEYYSIELSQKVNRGMKINAEKCLYNGGTIPFGYKIDENKKFQIDENKALIVKKIFNMYLEDYKMIEIVEYLNKNNIKTSKNNDFNKSSIERILTNKKYIGIYKFSDIEIKDGVPRIIDDETFEKVQKKLLKNKKAPATSKAKIEYLLTTKLFCGKCKDMMTGMSGTSGTKTIHSYYVCSGKKKKNCNKKNVRKEFIENIVIQEAKNILTDKNIEKISNEYIKYLEKQDNFSNIKTLEKNLKEIEKQKNNLIDSLKICNNDTIRKNIFEEFEKMEEKKQFIENEIATEKIQNNFSITKTQIEFFLNKLKNGNINDIRYRKLLITAFINKIYLYDDYLLITFNVTDNSNFRKIQIQDESSFLNSNGSPKKLKL